ncbi:MAG: phage terminase large subunit family protein, partial [Planctomycetota bacterium]
PFWREVMEHLSPQSPTERVVVMKSAQVGASELANCFIAYILSKGLGPTMLVTKSLELAKDYSKQRLDPMVRDTSALREVLGERTGQNDRNQLLTKTARGAPLFLRGAESAAGLRSMPIRNLVLDEVDSYPPDVEGEGDPCDLAVKRTETFHRRKILEISTPTIEGASRIADRYEATDQRVYLVPCPECGTTSGSSGSA